VAKSAGKVLKIPADFFLQENPQEISMVVLIIIPIVISLEKYENDCLLK
jgi:hypothetical protein